MEDKSHMVINRCRESFWQNSTTMVKKTKPNNWQQNGYRRDISQHNKDHMWQTLSTDSMQFLLR